MFKGNYTQIGLIAVLIGVVVYFAFTTTPIPKNEYVNGTSNYDTELYIVPNYITNEMILIAVVIIIAFYFSTKIKDIKNTRITEREFKEMISKEIRKKQTTPLPDGKYELPKGKSIISPDVLLRYKLENKMRIPFQYVAQSIITSIDGQEKYFVVTGNPNTKIIDDFVETKEKLGYKDKCPDCGRFFDVKYIMPEEIKELKEMKIFTQ